MSNDWHILFSRDDRCLFTWGPYDSPEEARSDVERYHGDDPFTIHWVARKEDALRDPDDWNIPNAYHHTDVRAHFSHEMAIMALLVHDQFVPTQSENGDVKFSWIMGGVNAGLGKEEWVDVPYEEIKPLYDELQRDPDTGMMAWICKKMGRRPRPGIEVKMREQGCWDDELEGLAP